MLDVALGHVGAGDLAQRPAYALELGLERLREDRFAAACGMHQLVHQDSPQRRGAIGADEALQESENVPPQPPLGRQVFPVDDRGRLSGEESQRRAIESFLAAEVVIHGGKVHLRGIDDVANAGAGIAVPCELFRRRFEQAPARVALREIVFGVHCLPLGSCRLLFETVVLNWILLDLPRTWQELLRDCYK